MGSVLFGPYFAVAAKSGVESAINVVPRRDEIVIGANTAPSSRDDLAVGLDEDGSGVIIAGSKVGCDQAITAERRIQRASRGQAG